MQKKRIKNAKNDAIWKRIECKLTYVIKNHGNINGNINVNLTDKEQKIINILLTNKKATLDQLADEIGVSKRTVSRLFKSLQEQSIIERVGSSKTGYWKIMK